MPWRIGLATLLLLVGVAGDALARGPLTDAEVRQQIVRESVAAYHSTGHPCACPEDLARNGSRCGGRSAYSRPGGASPLCYPSDVSDQMVKDWRYRHPQ